LWQGRFKATVIEAERYFMLCSRYVETQPVHAGLAAAAADYPWSSCVHHIGVKPDPLITDHQTYWFLGNTPFDREGVYRALLEQALTTGESEAISGGIAKGWALGSDQFKAALERVSQRRVSPAKPGRPIKKALAPS
jgi:putative transposase